MTIINKILSTKWFESLSISVLLYSIVFALLSLVTISIELKNHQTLVLESSYDIDPSLELEQPINIADISVFDQDTTILKEASESQLSVPNETDALIEIADNLDPLEDIDNQIVSPQAPAISDLSEPIYIGNSVSQDSSVGGVLDRLTVEIINNAQKQDLNVIWLLDASVSLSQQRLLIKERLTKILSEINAGITSHNIQHTICSFGSSLNILTPNPSNDSKELISAVERIVLDESGIENVFTAVELVCKQYKSYKHKNMILIFTDEIGDDVQILDKVVTETRKQGVPVYVVGPPAPFGLDKIQFKYIDPDPKFDQTEKWIEINQGPETLHKMTLDLHSLDIDMYGIDSGFGPYALNKLCMDTGGIYFAVHPNRNTNMVSKKQIAPLSSYISIFFDQNTMNKYSPDYRSLLLQNKEIQNNKIKIALLQACQIPINITYDQKMNFIAFNEGDFVEQLNDAQKFSAKIEPKLDQVYNILKSVEAGAKNLTEKRWIVSYNLAMGRILATKCRIELYNLMLAEAKSGLKKKDTKSNTWSIEYSDNFIAKSSTLQKNYDSAIKYLKSIIDNFPNTPWAYIAKAEIDTPMGYKWIEGYKEPPKSMSGGNNNNPIPRKDDEKKKLEHKPQRNITKI